jgi:hypothetical protein
MLVIQGHRPFIALAAITLMLTGHLIIWWVRALKCLYTSWHIFPLFLYIKSICREKYFGTKQKKADFLDNQIALENNRTDGINYKVCIYIYISMFLSVGTQSISSKIFKWNISRFFFLSQRLFDDRTGNMTDENDEEKKRMCQRRVFVLGKTRRGKQLNEKNNYI